jgi:hypothetical protein
METSMTVRIASALLALGLLVAPVSANAKSIWETLNETAPRSVFDDIRDTAPRSVFDEIRDVAPRLPTTESDQFDGELAPVFEGLRDRAP